MTSRKQKLVGLIVVLGTAVSVPLASLAASHPPAPNPFACQGHDHRYSAEEIRNCVIPRVFYKDGINAIHEAQDVAYCESTDDEMQDTNSGIPGNQAKGVFQFLVSTWREQVPARIRNHGDAIHHAVWGTKAAEIVSHHGEDWHQWACA